MAGRLTGPLSGYSTQARISLMAADLINNGRIRLWFATSPNPPDNDLSSNPLAIFAQLERVADKGKRAQDYGKVQVLLGHLRAWILGCLAADGDGAKQALDLIREVEDGRLELLQPIMLELRNTVPDQHIVGDEYIVENQAWKDQRRKSAYDLGRTPL